MRIRSCALVSEDEQLLLVKQKVPTRPDPIWLPPGGEVLFGETAASAAEREVFEECGLTIEISRLSIVHEFIEPPFHAVEFYFIANRTAGTLMTGSDPELSGSNQQILDCKFINFKKLGTIDLYPDILRNKMNEILRKNSQIIHRTQL